MTRQGQSIDGKKVWQEGNDCDDCHMADLPDKEKSSLNAGTSANFLLSNREAYIRSLKVTCTMSFQPQDNYEQIAHKSALFLIKGSHAKQLAPDLSHSWIRVFSRQAICQMTHHMTRLSGAQHLLTNQSTSWLMDVRDSRAHSIHWPIRVWAG